MKSFFYNVVCILALTSGFSSEKDVCDLSYIYNDSFSYCIPCQVVSEWFQGKGFGKDDAYPISDLLHLQSDIQRIYNDISLKNPIYKKTAIISAGAPGAGKTVLFKQLMEKNPLNLAYIDPDDVCLKSMEKTYLSTIAEITTSDLEEHKALRKAAYNYWRPGSNAACHIVLGNVLAEGFGFYFGTTSTSPYIANTFNFLKNEGYNIHLVHVITPANVRWGSIKERDKNFVQTTEEDIRDKGFLLPQRIHDYLNYADSIDFYFRSGVHEDAILTASWTKGNPVVIHDKDSYSDMVRVHNEICEQLENDSIRWENSVGLISY